MSKPSPVSFFGKMRELNPLKKIHRYNTPNDIGYLTPTEIYDSDPSDFPDHILTDYPDEARLLLPSQRQAVNRMLSIKKIEKENPRAIERRMTTIEEFKKGNPQVDDLLLKQKHDLLLPELHEKTQRLRNDIEIQDRMDRLNEKPIDMNSEDKKKLRQLERQIEEIEKMKVGGKKYKRKTFRKNKTNNKNNKKNKKNKKTKRHRKKHSKKSKRNF
uniref:Uncharacterized protein n=1 Tax=viral metagenome TaxID=1070528 RepID=A0A6C0D9H0_9ZZZZ